jgi:hypothetical protein
MPAAPPLSLKKSLRLMEDLLIDIPRTAVLIFFFFRDELLVVRFVHP